MAQKGSLVSPERLRFDFSHTKPMSAEELKAVEDMANAVLIENTPVVTRLMALDEARASGAMALFGEKYGDEVRVVSMGSTRPGANKAWSVELCGGTHVSRTGDIGLIRIVGESASAAGVRRLEALTGEGARAYLDEQDQRVKEAAGVLRTRPEELVARVKSLVEERKTLEKQLADAKRQLALGGNAQSAAGDDDAVRSIGKVKLLARTVQGLNPKDLRGLIDDGKKQVGSGIVAVVGVTEDGKAGLAVGVTDDLLSKRGAPSISSRQAPRHWAARVAAAGRTWRRPAVPMARKAGEALKAIEARLAG